MNKKDLKNLPINYHWEGLAQKMKDEQITPVTLATMVALGFRDAIYLMGKKDGIYDEDCSAWLRESELYLIAASLIDLSKPCSYGMLHRRITNYLCEKINEYHIEVGKDTHFPFDPYDDNLNYRVGKWMENYFEYVVVIGKYYYPKK